MRPAMMTESTTARQKARTVEGKRAGQSVSPEAGVDGGSTYCRYHSASRCGCGRLGLRAGEARQERGDVGQDSATDGDEGRPWKRTVDGLRARTISVSAASRASRKGEARGKEGRSERERERRTHDVVRQNEKRAASHEGRHQDSIDSDALEDLAGDHGPVAEVALPEDERDAQDACDDEALRAETRSGREDGV